MDTHLIEFNTTDILQGACIAIYKFSANKLVEAFLVG